MITQAVEAVTTTCARCEDTGVEHYIVVTLITPTDERVQAIQHFCESCAWLMYLDMTGQS